MAKERLQSDSCEIKRKPRSVKKGRGQSFNTAHNLWPITKSVTKLVY